jgi:hypothetical protein
MRMLRLIKTVLICSLLLAGILTLSACSSKKTPDTSTKVTNATSTTAPTDNTMITATPTPSITEISGTIISNDTLVTWVETTIETKTMYVNLTDGFLKIRKGPGKDYAQVGTLTDGMPVTVIALTDKNWYKLQDGFYVSGEYLSDTQ